MSTKAYGWEVDVEFCDKIVWAPSVNGWIQTFHYRGSESAAKRRAMLKTHAKAVIATRPLDQEQWERTYGLNQRM